MLSLNNINIGYKNKIVAKGINATLEDGELVALIGNNGVGKSTLLRTIAGFQPAIDSQLSINKESIGIVLTEKPEIQNLIVNDIIGFGRSPHTGFFGTLKDKDNEIVRTALQQVGINTLAERNFAELSDGEKQKVMIAKTLAQETPIILLDEPTAYLDYPSKIELMSLLQQLAHERNKSILFSTHDLELALQSVDKVWFMNGKDGLQICSPKHIKLSTTPPYISIYGK